QKPCAERIPVAAVDLDGVLPDLNCNGLPRNGRERGTFGRPPCECGNDMAVLHIPPKSPRGDLFRPGPHLRWPPPPPGIIDDPQGLERRGMLSTARPDPESFECGDGRGQQRRGAIVRGCGASEQGGLDPLRRKSKTGGQPGRTAA